MRGAGGGGEGGGLLAAPRTGSAAEGGGEEGGEGEAARVSQGTLHPVVGGRDGLEIWQRGWKGRKGE